MIFDDVHTDILLISLLSMDNFHMAFQNDKFVYICDYSQVLFDRIFYNKFL